MTFGVADGEEVGGWWNDVYIDTVSGAVSDALQVGKQEDITLEFLFHPFIYLSALKLVIKFILPVHFLSNLSRYLNTTKGAIMI